MSILDFRENEILSPICALSIYSSQLLFAETRKLSGTNTRNISNDQIIERKKERGLYLFHVPAYLYHYDLIKSDSSASKSEFNFA